MKKLTLLMGLLLSIGAAGISSAEERSGGPNVDLRIGVPFPGVRLAYGRPHVYCWYQGRYFDRDGWQRFERSHPYRYSYGYRNEGRREYRFDGDQDRRFNGPASREDRGYDRDIDRR